MKHVLVSLAFFVFSLTALAVEEGINPVPGMETEIFLQAFAIEGKENKANLYLYSTRELDLVWIAIEKQYVLSTNVKVSDSKMFGYRFPQEVDVTKIERILVQGWEVDSIRQFDARFEAKSAVLPINYSVTTYEHLAKPAPVLSAHLVETAPGSNRFHIDLVSLQNLTHLRIWDGTRWAKANAFPRTNKINYTYRATHTVDRKAGLNVDIKAKVVAESSGFTDKFVLRGEGQALAFELFSRTAKSAEEAEREEQEIVKFEQKQAEELARQQSANSYQGIAQARADAMARNQFMPSNHAIANAPAYPPGLFEGIGQGGPGCATCHGPDYGYHGGCVADASAVGANGQTYRVRFYQP